jgi:hypothetical protein
MMRAENRFTCDRCKVDTNVAVQNTAHRTLAPDGWLTVRLDEEIVPLHLCPACADAYRRAMFLP